MSERNKSASEIKRNFWRQHIGNWEASNISQKQYCQQKNISFTRFAWWRNKNAQRRRLKTPSFVPGIINTPSSVGTQGLQLILPNQLKLILPATLPMHDLATLIQLLGELS